MTNAVYRTRRPAAALRAHVARDWAYNGYAPSHTEERVLPTGTLELVIAPAAERLPWRELTGRCGTCAGAILCGPRVTAFDVPTRQQTRLVGVHFRAGGAWPVLGVSMEDLVDALVPPEAVLGRAGGLLKDMLADLDDTDACFDALDQFRVHQRIEQAIARSGTPFTILRPGGFMQNFVNHYAHWIRTEGALRLPCANGRENLVDARDVAAVAAVCLRDDAAPGRTLHLLGPEAMDCHDMMATLSREAGGSWAYLPIGDEEFRQRMRPYVVTPKHLEGLIDMFAFHRSGRAPMSSDVALYSMYYNFGRVHQTLRVTPAMEAGMANHVWSVEETAGLLG